ncbi:unnamed protein product, partial [Discosporangium mesarthrocarpum]
SRGNVGFTSSGKVVYPCASLGVVYDKGSHSQTLFKNHTRQISSLAVSPCGTLVATGQEEEEGGSAQSRVMIWDPCTGEVSLLP